MAIYTIVRVYEVPAENRIQATERMLEAIVSHVERDFHVNDYIKEPGDKPGVGHSIDLRPTGWLTLIKEQLGFYEKRFSTEEKRLKALKR